MKRKILIVLIIIAAFLVGKISTTNLSASSNILDTNSEIKKESDGIPSFSVVRSEDTRGRFVCFYRIWRDNNSGNLYLETDKGITPIFK